MCNYSGNSSEREEDYFRKRVGERDRETERERKSITKSLFKVMNAGIIKNTHTYRGVN